MYKSVQIRALNSLNKETVKRLGVKSSKGGGDGG